MSVQKVTSVILPWSNYTGGNVASISSTQAIPNGVVLSVSAKFGRRSTTAFSIAPYFFLQGTSVVSPGPGDWATVWQKQPALGSSVITQATTSIGSSSTAVLPMTTTTGFAAGQLCYVDEETIATPLAVPAQSEFFYLEALAGGGLTARENFKYAHTSGSNVYSQAEEYEAQVDANFTTYRVVVATVLASAVAFAFQLQLAWTNQN